MESRDGIHVNQNLHQVLLLRRMYRQECCTRPRQTAAGLFVVVLDSYQRVHPDLMTKLFSFPSW